MKVKSLFAATVLAAAASLPAMAENFSYNYIQVGYATGHLKSSGIKIDASGIGFSASTAINETIYLTGGFANQELSRGSATGDVDSYNVGIGARTSLDENTDLTTALSYVSSKTTVPGVSETATGYGLDFGLRHKVNDAVELMAGVGFTSAGSPNVNTTSISFGGRYKLENNISIGAGYTYSTNNEIDSNGFVIAARFEF